MAKKFKSKRKTIVAFSLLFLWLAALFAYAFERPVVQNQRKPREIIMKVDSLTAPNSAASISIGSTQLTLSDSTTADGTFPFTFNTKFHRAPIVMCNDDGTTFNTQVVNVSLSGFTVLTKTSSSRSVHLNVDSTTDSDSAASIDVGGAYVTLADSTTADGTYPFTFATAYTSTPVVMCVDEQTGFSSPEVASVSTTGFTVYTKKDTERDVHIRVDSTTAPNSAASIAVGSAYVSLTDTTTADGAYPFTFTTAYTSTPVVQCSDERTGYTDHAKVVTTAGFTVYTISDTGTVGDEASAVDSDFTCVAHGFDGASGPYLATDSNFSCLVDGFDSSTGPNIVQDSNFSCVIHGWDTDYEI